MAKPNFVTQLLEQAFEPGAVATSLQADDNGLSELLVERPHRRFILMPQFSSDEFSSFSFQIADRLLSCVKSTPIYIVCTAPPFSLGQERREFTSRREALAS